MGKLDGKVVLITGGARGIGRAIAATMAREGADIAICDIARQLPTVKYPLPTDFQETVSLVKECGRRCLAVQADVSRAAELQGVVERTIAEFGRIDILCANAGILGGGVYTWELTEEQWDEMLAVNLKGVWLAIKSVVPHMLGRGGGSIILTSSVAGLEGFKGVAHYVAAKHGVIGLMRTLANEAGPLGIRVNAVCPTGVNTPMVNNRWTLDLMSSGGVMNIDNLHLLPVELIESQDVANAVLWLASDEARYVTGVALPVDAGVGVKL